MKTAVVDGDADMVGMLIDAKADVDNHGTNVRVSVHDIVYLLGLGLTFLRTAVAHGDGEMVGMLINAKADVIKHGRNVSTCIHNMVCLSYM